MFGLVEKQTVTCMFVFCKNNHLHAYSFCLLIKRQLFFEANDYIMYGCLLEKGKHRHVCLSVSLEKQTCIRTCNLCFFETAKSFMYDCFSEKEKQWHACFVWEGVHVCLKNRFLKLKHRYVLWTHVSMSFFLYLYSQDGEKGKRRGCGHGMSQAGSWRKWWQLNLLNFTWWWSLIYYLILFAVHGRLKCTFQILSAEPRWWWRWGCHQRWGR